MSLFRNAVSSEAFAEDLQAQFRDLEIYIKQRVNDLFSGEFRSYFKGVGLEFEDVREYVYGDDVRSMDWNVTARSGKPYVRQFMDRRELSIYFLIDVSASNNFGTTGGTKQYELVRLFALLASAASHHQNNVGVIAFSDRIEYLRKAIKGQRHALQMAYDLLSLNPVGYKTNLGLALDELLHVRKNRSIVIVLTDLIEDLDREKLILANHLHDIIFVKLNDPVELKFPNSGIFKLVDLEGKTTCEVDCSSKKMADEMEQRSRVFRAAQINKIHDLGIDLLEMNVNIDFAEQLVHFFNQRKDRVANS